MQVKRQLTSNRASKQVRGDAEAADRGGEEVVVQPGRPQRMCKGLLVPLAHEIAEQLIVQVALHVEKGCEQKPFPYPAYNTG